ncbi:MAG: DUF4116 domain-containing protein [Burkholderiales bacterium]|nr:DUF4116 domain-containing protein [Burkholderiales bacterium]
MDLKAKKEALDLVKKNGQALQTLNNELRNDREIVLAAINQYCYALRFASNQLKSDKDVVLSAINHNTLSLQYASEKLLNDKQFISSVIKKDGMALQYASENLQDDKGLVLLALKNNGMFLQHVNKMLREDVEVISAALEQNNLAMKFVSYDKRIEIGVRKKYFGSYTGHNNKTIVLDAVKKDGSLLQYASKTLQNDKQIILTAVKQNGLAIQYASEELRDDKEVVFAAVNNNGLALKFASDTLRSNHEIVTTAISTVPNSFIYVSKTLQDDTSFLLSLIKSSASLISAIDNRFIKDIGFLCQAVQINEQSIFYLDSKYHENKHLMFLLLSYNYRVFKFLSIQYQNDINFLAEAYRQEPNFIIMLNLQHPQISSSKLEKVIYKKFANSLDLKLNSPTSQEVTNKMNQVAEAIDRIKREMHDNYLYIDEYYTDKFTSVINQDHFDQLKIEFIHDWYNKTIPDNLNGDIDYKKIKIDDQQALVIGSVSKNTKVTARAGSGKTATLVLRALFLNLHCRIQWDKMLIMAFNKNAADDINKKIIKYLQNTHANDYKNQNEKKFTVASTFHSFAHGIVNESHKELKLTTDDKSEKENITTTTPTDIIKTIFQNKIHGNHEQISKVKKIIFEHTTHFDDDVVNENQNSLSFASFSDPIADKSLVGINGYSYDNQNDKTIANWLTCCGLSFKYNRIVKTKNGGTQEVSFVLDNTKNKENKSFIIDLRISKDSFKNKLDHRYELIDLNINDVVETMAKFVHSVDCKKCSNPPTEDCEYAPPPIGCSNAKCKGVENVGLKCLLCNKNQLTICCRRCVEHCLCIPTISEKFSFLSNEEIWSKNKDNLLKNFLKAINNFINKCRALKISPDDLDEKIISFDFKPYYTKDFAEVALVVYRSYLNELKQNNLRDFTLTIDLASIELSRGNCKYAGGKKYVRDLQFVFVDEYQDFSVLFNDLVQGIIVNNPKVLTFCVGDDWQAINGFAGSDLKFFTNFKDYFTSPLELNMVTNYRSEKNIVEAGNLVMSGNGASSKSSKVEAGNIYIVQQDRLEPLNSKEETYFGSDKVSPYVYRIVKRLLEQGKDVSILSKKNNPRIKQLKLDKIEKLVESLKRFFSNVVESENGITISSNLIKKGSTVHKYKGQESEAIILLAPYSFPSIHQDWIFYQILGDTLEEIVQAERRLFYVAVTRAKQELYLIGDAGNDNMPFIDRAKWTEYGLISEINIQDFPALEKFPAETIHVTVKTPEIFGAGEWEDHRAELFKDQGFTWIDKDKIWAKDFPITNINNLHANENNKLKQFFEWLTYVHNLGIKFIINADYNTNKLFKDQPITKEILPQLKSKACYFMNLLAIEDYKMLETKIKMTGVYDFFSIVNDKSESFLFYLVNYDSKKLDLVFKILSNEMSEEGVKEIILTKNNANNNIFDKAVLIGNLDVVKYLVDTHLNTPSFIDLDKTYRTNNADVVNYLIKNSIKCTYTEVINESYLQLSNEKRYDNLIHFLNYKLPLEHLLEAILEITDKLERYLVLEHV